MKERCGAAEPPKDCTYSLSVSPDLDAALRHAGGVGPDANLGPTLLKAMQLYVRAQEGARGGQTLALVDSDGKTVTSFVGL